MIRKNKNKLKAKNKIFESASKEINVNF